VKAIGFRRQREVGEKRDGAGHASGVDTLDLARYRLAKYLGTLRRRSRE
jgi:hypothetical protein